MASLSPREVREHFAALENALALRDFAGLLRCVGIWLEAEEDKARRELLTRIERRLRLQGDEEDEAGKGDLARALGRLIHALEPPPEAPASLSILPDDPEGIELMHEFLAEAREHAASAEQALLVLERDPRHPEAIATVFRAFHTIKGVASLTGQLSIAALCHAAESLFSALREGRVHYDQHSANLALRAIDGLRQLAQRAHEGLQGNEQPKPPGLAALIEALEQAASRSDNLTQEESAARADASPPSEVRGQAAALSLPPSAAEAPGPPRDEANAPGFEALRSGGADASVRVRTQVLDRLVDMVGELVIAHSTLVEYAATRDAFDNTLQERLSQGSKILRELQYLSTSLRMVPLRATFRKMARVVRDTAQKCQKDVELKLEGEDTEIDRHMVDVLADPLVHMLRNAIDHGIEDAELRRERGKASRGCITLAARNAGGSVWVELSDDGDGLQRDRILQKAREAGLVSPQADPPDAEIFDLIFHPGLSTAAKVTDVSGRGVGMDVVRRCIEGLRGRIDVRSTPGRGTQFRIRLPLTLAITEGMLIRAAAQRYLLPTSGIVLTAQVLHQDIRKVQGRARLFRLRDRWLPLFPLAGLFGLSPQEPRPEEGVALVLHEGDYEFALLVDEILGQQQVVTKSLGDSLSSLPAITGGAILGDGGVGLILDPSGLAALARTYERNDARHTFA